MDQDETLVKYTRRKADELTGTIEARRGMAISEAEREIIFSAIGGVVSDMIVHLTYPHEESK